MDNKLLRPKEACEHLAVCRTTLYELMNAGKLGYVRIGADRRILTSEIASFIERNSKGGKR